MHETERLLRWRLGIYAATALTLLALYPQFALILKRGSDWNGSYAFFSQDEIAYSAYVNALIAGRPRRNDPYTGRDDAPDAPQPESIFSIQFIPAYLTALPARLLGLNASTTFILLTGMIAFASTLSIFWLIAQVTNDEKLAAAGALVVLCLGTFALFYAPVRMLFGLDTTYTFEYFPFLRRYVPAVPFPFFFIFCALVWRALNPQDKHAGWRWVALAGAVFALLVFSYFYLWTAAAAWFACLALLWLIARPEGYRKVIKPFGMIALLAIAALVPYFILLSNRAPTIDTVQLLALSHAPDFSRSSIKLGLMVCFALAYAAWRGHLRWRDHAVLFTASFALTPLVVFNQQIITGRSLQPLHYELYIAKYLSLIAVILAIALIRRGRATAGTRTHVPGRALVCAAMVSLLWGMTETAVETKRHAWASLDRDEAQVVARRLARLALDAPQTPNNQAVVLYVNLDHADISPVIAPQPVLWSPHVPAFSGVTLEENRERIYQYLYYTGEDLTTIDAGAFEALDYRKKYLIHSLIEWGHNDPAWTVNWRQLTEADVREALRGYTDYAYLFSRAQAASPTLAFVVTTTDAPPDFKNLDRWYERDAGERVGRFTLYRVRLRP
ncbi:MAG: hypothetical protein QOH25_3334 [Acidobacteriota bacterium]|nr:hypothetical protein [Acidobacteriota bacterium]